MKEISAPPIFVPTTSRKASCVSMMPLVAKAAKSNMAASDEWMIHVKMAAKAMAMIGSLSRGCIISGSVSDVFNGKVASRIRARESNMKPRPMNIVKRCFLRPPCSCFIWPMMPMARKAGESHERSKVRI